MIGDMTPSRVVTLAKKKTYTEDEGHKFNRGVPGQGAKSSTGGI